MKNDEQKRKPLNVSLYQEDLEKLKELSDKLGIKPSQVIRELIRNAQKSEVVQANIHYQMFQDYMNKKEQEYITAHNGQNDNKLTLKCSYSLKGASKSKAVDNTTKNYTNKEPENYQVVDKDIEMSDEEFKKMIEDIAKPDLPSDKELYKQLNDFIKLI